MFLPVIILFLGSSLMAGTIDEISKIKSNLNCQTITQSVRQLSEEALIKELQFYTDGDRTRELVSVSYHSWGLRLKVNQQLANLKFCEKEVRQLINNLRGLEDIAGLILSQAPNKIGAEIDFQKQPIPMIENTSYYGYYTREGLFNNKPIELESGDLLVTRGTSFFSATLSSITENPGDFSHFVLVHKNNMDNKVETLESYAQTGGISRYDIDYALKNENARILWLRPKFQSVARKGAEYFYQQILAEEAGLKSRTKYDYFMDLKTEDHMTCSEIAYWSYLKASQGAIQIPESKSKLPDTLAPILNLAKIPKEPMLSPQDMEVDSRFEMLAEFRDYRLVQDSRMRDAILRNIFSWMNQKGYKLHHNRDSFLLSYFIHPISKTPLWPMVKGMLNISMPEDAPKGFVRLLYQINDISENIYSHLKTQNNQKMKSTGFPLTKSEMDLVIENLRANDLYSFRRGEATKFHDYFHP